MGQKLYTVRQTIEMDILAETEKEATEIFEKSQDKWNVEFDVWERLDEKEKSDIISLYNALKSFRNSDCEKEWLDICGAYENDFFESMHLLEKFFRKGEYKKYGASIGEFSNPVLTFKFGDEWRGYFPREDYDIDNDIANLEARYNFL